MVVLNHVSVDLLIRVLRDGKLLVDRDRSPRIRFEVKTRFEFWDLEPYFEPVPESGRGTALTDWNLVVKKLSFIETCVRELRSLGRPEEIRRDVRQERFVEHTLQIAIQAALDVAAHIVSDERLGEPRTNRELFELLERHDWIPTELSSSLRRMVGFRNILVHGYEDVDLAIVETVATGHLDDLLQFASLIRAKL